MQANIPPTPSFSFCVFLILVTLFLLLSSQSAFKTVTVERMPPRPALQKLGLNYRRIPVLAIDGDIILDTSLMVEELEKRFTVKDGFKTLWPGNTAGEIKFFLRSPSPSC